MGFFSKLKKRIVIDKKSVPMDKGSNSSRRKARRAAFAAERRAAMAAREALGSDDMSAGNSSEGGGSVSTPQESVDRSTVITPTAWSEAIAETGGNAEAGRLTDALLSSHSNDSSNFSFANFDWLGYGDLRANSNDTQALRDDAQQSGVDNQSMPSYRWVPFVLPLEDGSKTIAFKMRTSSADQLANKVQSDDSADQKEVQRLLLSDSQEVLTTPSRADRVRGMKKSAIVVRTPASLIDLMDDQVPDLREGFFPDPQDPQEVSKFSRSGPLTGNPLAVIAEKLGIQALLDVGQAIIETGLDKLGSDFSIGKLGDCLQRVAWNNITPLTLGRIIKAIYDGELTSYIRLHPDENIYDNIINWIAQWYWEGVFDDPDSSKMKRDTPDSRLGGRDNNPKTIIKGIPSRDGGDGWGDDDLPRHNEDNCCCASHDRDFYASADYDAAFVPVSYWRHLYSLGRTFRRRDMMPSFSSLAFTGSPSADLLLNRVPKIYIGSDGQPNMEYWRYGSYPLSGGLFSCIKKAAKKVAGAVKKVGSAVAKGVSKVMDSPLGSVISAIPVVGNVASVAGKVAGVINKVTSVTDKIGLTGDDASSESDQASDAITPNGDSSASGDLGHAMGLIRGDRSDVVLGKNGAGQFNVSSVPVWTAASEDYSAPPLSLLTGHPGDVIAFSPTMLDTCSLIGRNSLSRCPSGEEVVVHLRELADNMRALDHRGPWIARDLSMRTPNPKGLARTRSYWRTGTRGSEYPISFAGDPAVGEATAKAGLGGLSPMADWMNVPSLHLPDGAANPYAQTFYQLGSDPGTKSLISHGHLSEQALKSFCLQPPYCSRIKDKSRDISIELVAAVTWAMLLVSSSGLSDSQRQEIADVMSVAAMAGLWTQAQVGDLLGRALKKEWPTASDMKNKQVAVMWTRMLADTIGYVWNEASGATGNTFSVAIASVAAPSREAISGMCELLNPQPPQNAKPDRSVIAPNPRNGGSKGDDATSLLNDLISGEGLSDPEAINVGDNRWDDPSLSDVSHHDAFTYPDSLDYSLSDYWLMASRICRAARSENAARLRMRALRIPDVFISLALQRYYPTQDAGSAPMVCIPLTRKDYMLYSYHANQR